MRKDSGGGTALLRIRQLLQPGPGNQALADDPSLVNQAAEGEGWFFRLRLSDPAELEKLMGEDDYKAYIETL